MAPSEQVRILPTEWVGTWVGATWGAAITPHHPKFHTHGHLEHEWHGVTVEATISILRQEGRSLELVIGSSGHESKAVGALSSDGRRLVVVTQEHTYHVSIDGNEMTGQGECRAHGSDRSDSFSAAMVEFTALT
ncbi:MAG: hypothetical protein WCI12_08375 [Actinomycetes bacterium]